MHQPGFPLAWEGERQLRLPQLGHSAQAIRDANQRGVTFNNTVALQPDASFPLQQSALPPSSRQVPKLDPFGNNSQAFGAQSHAWDTAFRSILSHPDIAIHRDGVCSYLRIPTGLWNELYNPQVSEHVHHLLTECLARNYGTLPDDLRIVINELRDLPEFPHLQAHLVHVTMSAVPEQDHPQTQSVPSGQDLRPTINHSGGSDFDRSGETSPGVVISSPRTAQSGQTAVTTPLSMGNARSTPQTPFQRTKGRAPRGKRYKCPYTNCKHEPFRNAGNFNNHMRSCHAESPYRNQHPSDFLVADLSPQHSIQGDTMSSAVTNSSGSPLSHRRPSREFGNGEALDIGDRNTLEGVGHNAVYPASHAGLEASVTRGDPNHADPQEAQVTSGLVNSSLLEGFTFIPNSRQHQPGTIWDNAADDTNRPSPTQAGPVGFHDFQMMERSRCGDRYLE
ncbi:hypothetical protein A1O7_06459 [Cladophialophora yegresii CBS 114405]|uniref:C2H2-type domain-containing protein n=1 Tax=Cladophialophora yegresii CBS 114405 TaxID=1182544 RepID=W9VTY8_9EURO|nr:uncharacterized protein A1O7_06459 [Cladophialophora yegresii CBS 114405]EXJ59028.1 hypothetical protein A1O7_06459 [Cladophialophora yegresii CBS 114405]